MNKRVLFFSLGLLLTAAPMAQAQLFGPSDEEKAREASQNEQLSTLAAQNQQLEGRVQVLEDKTRSLTQTLAGATNTNEELRHQLDLMNQRDGLMARLASLNTQQRQLEAQVNQFSGADVELNLLSQRYSQAETRLNAIAARLEAAR